MEELFDICVEIMKEMSAITGYTYKEINIIIFVILQPLFTLGAVIMCLYLKNKIRKQTNKT